MPKNEDGEFELILGNKQLLSMFFVVVILLGVFFVMGYIVGRNSAPVANVEPPIHKPSDAKPADSTAPKQVGEAEPAPPTSTVTATQLPEKTVEKAPPPPVAAAKPAESKPVEAKPVESKKPVETAKAEPPAKREPKPAEKSETAKVTATKAKAVTQTGPPAPGMYLQLSATSKTDADAYVEILRKNGFQALDAEVPENPKLFRVLVGPVPAGETNKMKEELKSKGMPEGIRQKY